MATFEAQNPERAQFERVRSIIPNVVQTGNIYLDDTYPTVSYHAYPDRESFSHDDFYDGSNQGVNNAYYGPGLYCGSEELARKYGNYFHMQGRRRVGIERIAANRAILIDLDQPEAYEALTDIQVASAMEFVEAKRSSISSTDELKGLESFRQYLSSQRGVKPSIVGIARMTGHAEVGGVAGIKKQVNLGIEWLTSIGVDGVISTIDTRVSNNERCSVYWRRDKVSDIGTLEKRMNRLEEARSLFSEIGMTAIGNVALPVDQIHIPARHVEGGLDGSRQLSQLDAKKLLNAFSDTEVLSDEQSDILLAELRKPELDTYKLMKQFAGMNPAINRLLSAETGVWERYRLHEHTQAVMNQFENNWVGNIDPQLNETRDGVMLMRLMLLVHDLGKPLANTLHGDARTQGVYNEIVARSVLDRMLIPELTKELITDIVKIDIFGDLLKRGNKDAVDSTARMLAELAEKYGEIIDSEALFDLVFLEHECDGSSYTDQARYRTSEGKLANSKPGLNREFRLDSNVRRVKHRRQGVTLIGAVKKRYDQLLP